MLQCELSRPSTAHAPVRHQSDGISVVHRITMLATRRDIQRLPLFVSDLRACNILRPGISPPPAPASPAPPPPPQAPMLHFHHKHPCPSAPNLIRYSSWSDHRRQRMTRNFRRPLRRHIPRTSGRHSRAKGRTSRRPKSAEDAATSR